MWKGIREDGFEAQCSPDLKRPVKNQCQPTVFPRVRINCWLDTGALQRVKFPAKSARVAFLPPGHPFRRNLNWRVRCTARIVHPTLGRGTMGGSGGPGGTPSGGPGGTPSGGPFPGLSCDPLSALSSISDIWSSSFHVFHVRISRDIGGLLNTSRGSNLRCGGYSRRSIPCRLDQVLGDLINRKCASPHGIEALFVI